jgi:hypothetical protein
MDEKGYFRKIKACTVPAPKIGPLETLDFFGFLRDSVARMHLARLVPHQKG